MTTKPLSPLGSVQRSILRSMADRKRWYLGCGWHWESTSETVRLLDTLEKRGYVRKSLRQPGIEHLTGADLYPYLRYDYIDPNEHEQARMERLVEVLHRTVQQYDDSEPLMNATVTVPDDLLIALARAAKEFLEGVAE